MSWCPESEAAAPVCPAVNEMVLSSKINILMLCVPLGIAAQLAHWGAIAVFILVRSLLQSRCIAVMCFSCCKPSEESSHACSMPAHTEPCQGCPGVLLLATCCCFAQSCIIATCNECMCHPITYMSRLSAHWTRSAGFSQLYVCLACCKETTNPAA